MRDPDFWWRQGGPSAALLSPLAALYDAIATRRMRSDGAHVATPVICIGNPTVGGAGKTPTAIAVACLLKAQGCKPAFLTRGYGGALAGPVIASSRHDARAVGDEPLLLARVAPTVVARDRAAGAALAIANGADILVMDDGFQNPALAKDFSVLVIDGRRGLGNGRVLPAGPLRARFDAQLARAQALLVVGEEAAPAGATIALAQRHDVPVWRGRLVPDEDAIAGLAGRRLLAFAGIGQPDKFFTTLRHAGLTVAATAAFADHHVYTEAEASDLATRATRERLVLVTTEKDYMRLTGVPALAEFAARVLVLPVTLAFDQPDMIAAALRRVSVRST